MHIMWNGRIRLCSDPYPRPSGSFCCYLGIFLLYIAGLASASQIEPEWWYEPFSNQTGRPTSVTVGGDDYLLYHNLWFHNDKFLAVEDSSVKPGQSSARSHKSLSRNADLLVVPAKEASQFYANLKAGFVPGTTLLVDFPFPAFPDNQGHWAEALLPVYHQMVEGKWRSQVSGGSRTVDRILLSNLHRESVQGLMWVQGLLKLVLQLDKGMDLPPVLVMDHLEDVSRKSWLCFQDILLVRDRYTHPRGLSGFRTVEEGRAFRDRAYEQYGIAKSQPWKLGGAPRTITLLSAVGGEEVVNRDELVGALADVAESMGMHLRPFSITSGASMQSFIHAMARTGVLVSRHGPLLANTMFLPPGAVVLELLPYNWEWQDISRIYVNISRSLGDIHHLGWRASSSKFVRYASPEDALYAGWDPSECHSPFCLEVHARAGMLADTATLSEMLLDILPGVFTGETPEALRLPWPGEKSASP